MYNLNVQKITRYLDELSKLAPQFLKDHYEAKDNTFPKKEGEFAEYQNEEPFAIRNWRYDREHQLDRVILNGFNKKNDTDLESVIFLAVKNPVK